MQNFFARKRRALRQGEPSVNVAFGALLQRRVKDKKAPKVRGHSAKENPVLT